MIIISFMFPAAGAALSKPWLGEWRVQWKNTLGEQFAGNSRLSQPWNHAWLKEELEASDPGLWSGWKGVTLAKFNPRSRTWHYTWHDNRGGYCDFIGQFHNDTFSLQYVDAEGKPIRQRMLIKQATAKSLAWDCERYEAKACVWRKMWKVEYRRH